MQKKMKPLVMMLAVSLVLAGCTTKPPTPWTREEAQTVTTRTYKGVSPDQALAAAEQIFRLADAKDLSLSYGDGTLQAQRNVLVYAVLAAVSGNYVFEVVAKPTTGGTVVSMNTRSNLSGTYSFPTSEPVSWPQGYRLFFDRMDYMLGKSDVWLTCPAARKAYAVQAIEDLCLNAEDKAPTSRVKG
jgi:hypothetical protein